MEHNLSPLQQEVLDKYKQLSLDLKALDETIKELNYSAHRQQHSQQETVSPDEILQEMRDIEVKIGLVGTLLKVACTRLSCKESKNRSLWVAILNNGLVQEIDSDALFFTAHYIVL